MRIHVHVQTKSMFQLSMPSYIGVKLFQGEDLNGSLSKSVRLGVTCDNIWNDFGKNKEDDKINVKNVVIAIISECIRDSYQEKYVAGC